MKKYVVALSFNRQRVEETTRTIAERLGKPYAIQTNTSPNRATSYTGYIIEQEATP